MQRSHITIIEHILSHNSTPRNDITPNFDQTNFEVLLRLSQNLNFVLHMKAIISPFKKGGGGGGGGSSGFSIIIRDNDLMGLSQLST